MISHLIDPAILGFVLIGVMLFSIFIGFPIIMPFILFSFNQKLCNLGDKECSNGFPITKYFFILLSLNIPLFV